MLSTEKQDLLRKRLIEGSLIEEIAAEVGCSKSTILRYKKKMPASSFKETEDTGDNNIKFTQEKLYTKYEKMYIEKLEDDAELYTDEEEGWVFHLDKANYVRKTNSIWWSAIAYPESVEEHWKEKLEQLGFQIAISPLHDKDIWTHNSPKMVNEDTGEIVEEGQRYKAGDRKKAHWHIIIICGKSTSFKEINNLVRPITNGPYLQKCRSIKLSYDYFTHNTDAAKRAGKYRYEADEIIRLNDFTVVPNKYEVGLLQTEITNTIMEKGFCEVWQVAEYYKNQPEIMTLFWAKPGFLTSLLRSLYKKQHPESRVQLVKEISEEEYAALRRKE